MMKLKVYFLALSALCSLARVDASAQGLRSHGVVSHGTLVVGVPTRDGLVICADKRIHTNKGDKDDYSKIRSLGKYWIFAAAGLIDYSVPQVLFPTLSLYSNQSILGMSPAPSNIPRVQSPTVIEISKFNLNRIIESYYTGSAYDLSVSPQLMINPDGTLSFKIQTTERTLKGLAERLARELNQIRTDLSRAELPSNLLFEVHFFYVTKKDELKQEVILALCTRDLLGSFDIQLRYGEASGDLLTSKPIVWGSPDLYLELINPTRREFDKLRRDHQIKPFLWTRPAVKTESGKALAFVRRLIRETAKRGAELNSKIWVSEACDCGILNPTHGFVSIPSNKDKVHFEKTASEPSK